MQKKAKISLKTSEEDIEFSKIIEFKNNKINYIEDITDTNVLLDIDKKLLIRDNKNIYLEYDFLNGKGYAYIKDLGSETVINLKVDSFISNDKLIEIIYNIDDNNYKFKIEME